MLSETLKSLRKENRYSQTEIANHLHITRQAYNHYETGKRIPPLETIKKLADFYGVSADVFLSSEKDVCNELNNAENTIQDNLKRIRKEKGYTQDDVANFLNVKRQTYSSYERGVSLPDIETIKKLTCFFNVSINELAEAEREPSQSTNNDLNNTPLSTEEGALLLQEKLKDTPLVNEQGVITKEGADIFATFLINNADMLAKLLNDKNNP